jgi:5-formyltetrahydrofolate cyclo-ligase
MPEKSQPPCELAAAKKSLASRVKQIRRLASESIGKRQTRLISDRFMEARSQGLECTVPGVISGYWPINHEIDITQLLRSLHGEGMTICLPVYNGLKRSMIFRSWEPGDVLYSGTFGVYEPSREKKALRPAVLLVPLLAFDALGNRLGYGGGCYDSTIIALRRLGDIITVGVAFDCQQVDSVPADERDQRMDWIITEEKVMRLGRI